MKNNKYKIIASFFLIAILCLSTISYYNKPHKDVKKIAADYVLTSQNIINQYVQDEVEADKKYSEKVIELQGEIHEITALKGASVITLKGEIMESSIICYMQPEENRIALQYKKGDNVTIRGICTGYLLDVIMVKCIFID